MEVLIYLWSLFILAPMVNMSLTVSIILRNHQILKYLALYGDVIESVLLFNLMEQDQAYARRIFVVWES
jgi:hypothetical protein